MDDDSHLLRLYAESGSQAAFSEVVRRHLPLVYNASLRRTGQRADLAMDVTQQVFITLAQNALALSRHELLTGWLFTATRYSAFQVLRSERRRLVRETAAYDLNQMDATASSSPSWEAVKPALDQALDNLNRPDRDALLLRFFERKSMAAVARELSLSESAANKRVQRALERLRSSLARHGVRSSSAALSLLLASEAVAEVPPAVAASATASISSLLLAGASAASFPLPLIPLMTTSKISVSLVAVAGILFLAGLSTTVYETHVAHREEIALQASEAAYKKEVAKAQADKKAEQAAAAERLRLAQASAHERNRAAAKEARDAIAAAVKAGTYHKAGKSTSPAGQALARQFFASNPEARAMNFANSKAVVRKVFGIFLDSAGLSADQIDQYTSTMAEAWTADLSISPQGDATYGDLTPEQAQSILGASGYAQYQQYHQIAIPYSLTTAVASSVAANATPMSLDQASELAQVIASNSSLAGTGVAIAQPNIDSGSVIKSVDWETVLTDAQALFTPTQWQSAEPALVQYQLVAALMQAASPPPAPSPSP